MGSIRQEQHRQGCRHIVLLFISADSVRAGNMLIQSRISQSAVVDRNAFAWLPMPTQVRHGRRKRDWFCWQANRKKMSCEIAGLLLRRSSVNGESQRQFLKCSRRRAAALPEMAQRLCPVFYLHVNLPTGYKDAHVTFSDLSSLGLALHSVSVFDLLCGPVGS